MSLEALLSNDAVSVQQRAPTHRDASGGMQAGGWSDLYAGVSARVETASAMTQQYYAMRGMVVSETVYTQQAGIGTGMRLLTSDGRYLLVEGVRYRRQIGGMSAFYHVDCSEYRPGA